MLWSYRYYFLRPKRSEDEFQASGVRRKHRTSSIVNWVMLMLPSPGPQCWVLRYIDLQYSQYILSTMVAYPIRIRQKNSLRHTECFVLGVLHLKKASFSMKEALIDFVMPWILPTLFPSIAAKYGIYPFLLDFVADGNTQLNLYRKQGDSLNHRCASDRTEVCIWR